MPISRQTARRLMDVVEECGKGLFAMLPVLEAELSPEEFKRLKREVARVISTMDECISANIASEYPDLAPEAVPIARKPST